MDKLEQKWDQRNLSGFHSHCFTLPNSSLEGSTLIHLFGLTALKKRRIFICSNRNPKYLKFT